MMQALLSWLLANSRAAYLLALFVSILFGIGGGELYRITHEDDYQERLANQVQREAIGIVGQTLEGKPMGAVALAGQYEVAIRAIARSPTVAAKDYLAEPLEILARSIDGDGAFVVNGEGVITASWDMKGRSRNGNSVQHRPYYQMAMEGMESVYAAVGGSTNERALYIAAPVFGEPGQGSRVIGAVVGRIDVRNLDRAMNEWPGIAMLLSPQGVVFASSRAEWLFRLAGPVDAERIKTIAGLKQFGKTIEPGANPQSLPFEHDSKIVRINGKRYAAESAPVALNDPNGEWSVMLLGDLDKVTPLAQRIWVGAFAGVALFALLLVARHAYGENLARRAAMAEIERAAVQLEREAERKSQRGEFVAALQQAVTPQELAAGFFRRLARLLPLHQGALYRLDASGGLSLAGAYGTADAPLTIVPGEGLAGQCALERRVLSFGAPPEGFWRVRSGLGDAAPRYLLLLPVMRNDSLLGILELASRNADFAGDRALIDELLPVLAVNLEILLATERTEQALTEARAQAEEFSAQQTLGKEVEDWLLTVLDNAPDALLVADESGDIVLANLAAARLFGYAKAQLETMRVEDLMPERFRADHAGRRAGFALDSDAVVVMAADRRQVRALTRDGREISVAVSLSALPSLGFRGPCVCAIIRRA